MKFRNFSRSNQLFVLIFIASFQFAQNYLDNQCSLRYLFSRYLTYLPLISLDLCLQGSSNGVRTYFLRLRKLFVDLIVKVLGYLEANNSCQILFEFKFVFKADSENFVQLRIRIKHWFLLNLFSCLGFNLNLYEHCFRSSDYCCQQNYRLGPHPHKSDLYDQESLGLTTNYSASTFNFKI